MEYRIDIQPRAQADLDEIYERVVSLAPYRGLLWFERLESAISALRTLPERNPVDARLADQGERIHKLLFGKRPHQIRVYYVISAEIVHVLHVRHGRREPPDYL